MSVERLCQAREQLRRQFMEYVENLATGDSADDDADDDIDQVVNLREAIDALDHAIKGGWHEPSSEPGVLESRTWMEADEDELKARDAQRP